MSRKCVSLLSLMGLILLVTSCGALSEHDIELLGRKIYKNEAAEQEELLVFWNENETFPSFGILHAIWLPVGNELGYVQQFPLLCDYLKKQGVTLPAWLEEAKDHGAPWHSREEFYNDHARLQELRALLAGTISLQAHFLVEHAEHTLLRVVAATPAEQCPKVQRTIELLWASSVGVYALVDYLNFKGDGLNPREESNGQRWGLQAVLLDMPDALTPQNVRLAFTVAAAKRLLMLIEHSAPDYRRVKRLSGWMRRISTYAEQN